MISDFPAAIHRVFTNLDLFSAFPLIFVIILSYIISTAAGWRKRNPPLPPGPPSLPLIGNTHQLMTKDVWRQLRKFNKIYGPVVHLKVGSNTIILLGSHQTIHDLHNKRSRKYSSRPQMLFAQGHICRGLNPTLLPSNEKWKRARRFQTSVLNANTVRKYHGVLDVESMQLVHELQGTTHFSEIFSRYSTSISHTLVFGRRLKKVDDDTLKKLSLHEKNIAKAVYGGTNMAVEVWPILNLLPRYIAPWKRIGARLYHEAKCLFENGVDEAMETTSWNITKHFLKMDFPPGTSKTELAFQVGGLMEAGTGTVSRVLEFFIMSNVLYPEATNRAQLEIDTLVGRDRLPVIEDLGNLRYLHAYIKELLRWQPVIPQGVPHATVEDDIYNGYFIPKGSTIITPHWGLDLNEDIFDDPFNFRPERWLENPDLPLSAFGFGQRACPGQHLAWSSLGIAISRILWAYNISHAYENGERIEIDPYEREQSALSGPTSFDASVYVRSDLHREVIEKTWKIAEKDENILLEKMAVET